MFFCAANEALVSWQQSDSQRTNVNLFYSQDMLNRFIHDDTSKDVTVSSFGTPEQVNCTELMEGCDERRNFTASINFTLIHIVDISANIFKVLLLSAFSCSLVDLPEGSA